MRVQVLAISENKNSFGLRGVILEEVGAPWNLFTAREPLLFEAGLSSSATLYEGEEFNIPHYSSGFYGLNWAAMHLEIPRIIKPFAPKPIHVPDPPKPTWCIRMYRGNSVSALRSSEPTTFGKLRGVVQHYQLFGSPRPERIEIVPV